MGDVKKESIFHVFSCLDFTFLGFHLAVCIEVIIRLYQLLLKMDGRKNFLSRIRMRCERPGSLGGWVGEYPVLTLPSQLRDLE